MFKLPEGAMFVLDRLTRNGHQAYVVGGCVRDSLLGRAPKDWDICTSALPEEMQRIFADCHVIETGLKHGTLTVMYQHEPFEATTFRVDGDYSDHRHPDEVSFVTDVLEDLARRDFTINAMAYHPDTGLVDAFGGQEDLARRCIRCVGDAPTRFDEDALRILRALRFASVYGFDIEEKTSEAIHQLKHTLKGVAAERIRVEIAKLVCGEGAEQILRQYSDVLFTLFPSLSIMEGFAQRTPYHRYDVWEHTLHALSAIAPEEPLRLTMLLHDSGKPYVFTVDERGVGHAYGHPKRSMEIARQVLTALKVDHATLERVTTLVAHHDAPLNDNRRLLLRRLSQFGPEVLHQLIEVHRADSIGKGMTPPERINEWALQLHQALDRLLAENPCFTLKSLAVNGNDLMQAGIPKGSFIGQCLQYLLDGVIESRWPNERERLLLAATKYAEKVQARKEGLI